MLAAVETNLNVTVFLRESVFGNLRFTIYPTKALKFETIDSAVQYVYKRHSEIRRQLCKMRCKRFGVCRSNDHCIVRQVR